MLSNELTEIVGTTESLANMCEKGKNTQEVVEFESSNIPQIIADVEDVINSTFIEDHIRSELEFQDLEEPIVVSLDGYNSQPDTKPEIDPLSELVAVKSESLGLENEKSLKNNTTFIDNDNKVMSFFVKRESGICPKCNLSCDPEGHVCLFKCDLCPYTAKYSRVLGQHKRRDHKILGSSKKVVGKNRQTVVKQNVGKHFQCNLCSYTARFSQIIGQHKRRVHNIVGIRSLQLNKKHAIVRNEQLSEKEEEQPLTENKQVSCRKDKRTQRHTVSREKEYKCNSCPYVTISSDAFRVHKRRKHSIQQNIKTIADITTLSVCNGKEKKPKKVTINRGKDGFKKRLNKIPRHKQFSIKSSNFISSSTKPTTSSDDLSDQQNITQVADYETYPNTEDISCDSKYYTATVFESQDIKHDEFSIIDTVNLKTIPESCSPSLVNFNPEPLIVNSQTLDEDSWIDIEENLNNIGTDICSKCNLSYDSNDHVCIYKCYLCSFTSRYSKVIIRHKLKVHKTQSVTGKFFKCDLCPFSAKYIQSIGKHKTKVHNVIGQASETFLKNKQCIIGNEVVKRFKCDLCPYKAKYIQNIGVHMKRVHETEGRTSEGCVREASVTETEVSDREHDAEVVNQEIQKDSEKDTLINIVENSVTPFSQGEKNTCPKCKMSCDSNNHVCSFKCNLCSYTSKYRKVILKHKNRVHNCSVRFDIVENTVTTFSQREKNTCPKCKMSSDSNNHICSFKCNLCTYTSKYRKLILKHKNQVHNCSVKPKNQPALGRYFKCDICSFTDKYIQNIGKHKIKVHKIIGQASEEYLRTKQCIIENQVGKLFKCNLCPYTAKYIQTIGVHKKRVHETIGRTSEEFLKEASAIETEVSREKFDTEIVNQEIQIILQDIELPPISDGATTSNENQRTQNRSNMKIKDVSEEIVDNFPKPSSEDESKHVSDTEKTISNFSLGGDINVKIQSQEKLSIKKRNKKKSNVGRKQNSDDAELYKCNNCPYETKNIGALHKHRWSKHKDSRKIKHIKGQSEKKQVMKRKLNERRKEVRKVKIGGQVRLICNCGKMYKNKFSLESHLRYHCNQEPRQCCYLCDYKTHRRSEVYRHQRTVHKLDIPYTKNRLKS